MLKKMKVSTGRHRPRVSFRLENQVSGTDDRKKLLSEIANIYNQIELLHLQSNYLNTVSNPKNKTQPEKDTKKLMTQIPLIFRTRQDRARHCKTSYQLGKSESTSVAKLKQAEPPSRNLKVKSVLLSRRSTQKIERDSFTAHSSQKSGRPQYTMAIPGASTSRPTHRRYNSQGKTEPSVSTSECVTFYNEPKLSRRTRIIEDQQMQTRPKSQSIVFQQLKNYFQTKYGYLKTQ